MAASGSRLKTGADKLKDMVNDGRGRVEIWRSDTEVFCFQIPLIKPDVRISRIRLSDKLCSVRPRQVSAKVLESD